MPGFTVTLPSICTLSVVVSGVLVGRGVLRNPWVLAQAADLVSGRVPRDVTMADRGRFLLDYIDLLLHERAGETAGFRHVAPTAPDEPPAVAGPGRDARGRERWVINKLRALCAWYSKGLDGGSGLRVRINAAGSIGELRDIVAEFFLSPADSVTPEQNLSSVR